MKNLKIFAMLILALVVIGCFVACDKPEDEHVHVFNDPTCLKPATCECGAEEGEPFGHTYRSEVTKPTCTTEGYTTYTCFCGDTYKADFVDKIDHSYESAVIAPTCTTEGYTAYTCVCGDTYKADFVDKTDHSYESTVIAPTCTAAGYTVHTCSCGDSYKTDEVAATGHSYTATVIAPTCTAAGYTVHACSCGDSYKTDEVAATGHSYTATVIAPTCTAAGYTVHACSCGDSYKTDEVAATGHSHSTTVTAPTCTETGYTTYTCACGDTYKSNEVPAKGHNVDGNGVCSNCGETISSTPESTEGYVFGMYQGNLGKTYYLKGGMNGYYMETTEDVSEALLVYLEETEGGYYFYCYVGNTKTYINMVVSEDGEHVNGAYEAKATTVYTFDEKNNTLVAEVDGNDYWFGTRNDRDYKTVGPCKVSYNGFICTFSKPHTEHIYENGVCDCGAKDPNYNAGGNEGEKPDDEEKPGQTVTSNKADFDTIVTKNANGDSSYSTHTTKDGWTVTNSAIQCGGTSVANPQFPIIGANNTFKAVCLNGNKSAKGTLTSPTIKGGISKLTMDYTKMFSDTKLSVTIKITDLSTGKTYTKTVSREAAKDTKYVVWTECWTLDTPITGDFKIEIVNDCPSNSTGNKDRITILNLSWE